VIDGFAKNYLDDELRFARQALVRKVDGRTGVAAGTSSRSTRRTARHTGPRPSRLPGQRPGVGSCWSIRCARRDRGHARPISASRPPCLGVSESGDVRDYPGHTRDATDVRHPGHRQAVTDVCQPGHRQAATDVCQPGHRQAAVDVCQPGHRRAAVDLRHPASCSCGGRASATRGMLKPSVCSARWDGCGPYHEAPPAVDRSGVVPTSQIGVIWTRRADYALPGDRSER
jgi:hypothetical protein